METITRISERRNVTTEAIAPPRDATSTLAATATYLLSEDGRKASLLQGGDGRAVQTISLHVPTHRLHLVSVDAEGHARLRLRPCYQPDGDQRVVQLDAEPTYDAPPTIDELYQAAARNHESERAYHVARTADATKRRESQHEIRQQLAESFVIDKNARALLHPPPTARVCFLTTPQGRVRFDASRETGLAKEVPLEAYRRFRSDERATQERRRAERAANLELHEAKKRYIAEWIAANGSDEQRGRQAKGLLPLAEAVELLTDQVFAALAEYPRYTYDGAERLARALPESLRVQLGSISRDDLVVESEDAHNATTGQFGLVRQIEADVPHATVVLRRHRIALKRNGQTTPSIAVFGVLVTQHIGPFVVRREFAAPDS